jgi:phosphoglycolate phosphatase
MYPGTIDAISHAFVNMDLFLVTNKRIIPTIKILQHHNMWQYFKVIIGCDSVENNGLPKDKSISHLINEYGLSKLNCTYFGDTKGDAVACYEAGIDFFYVSWGYGDIREIANLNCSILNDWAELDDFTGRVKLI